MRNAALAIAALIAAPAATAPAPPPAEPAAALHLVLEGLRSARGSVRVCLWRRGEGFPNCTKGIGAMRFAAPAAAPRVAIDIERLEPGEYGVSVIHDENDNRRLDKSFIGLPTEGVGFSNNASAPFGPPDFRRVRFTVDGAAAQTIRMRYYL